MKCIHIMPLGKAAMILSGLSRGTEGNKDRACIMTQPWRGNTDWVESGVGLLLSTIDSWL